MACFHKWFIIIIIIVVVIVVVKVYGLVGVKRMFNLEIDRNSISVSVTAPKLAIF